MCHLPVSMGHPLRWYQPDVVYEFTTRTIQERFLLRPSAESRELILGVIARAQLLYTTVQVYAFVFLSNHYHLLCSAGDGDELALFIGYVNGNVARELGRLHSWRGALWGRRVRPIPVLDDAALVERFRYLLANGVKEGLVASPREWPGASAVPALLGSMSLPGTWIDRDGLRRARAKDRNASATRFTSHPEVVLSPLPCWRDLGPDELRSHHEQIIGEIEQEAATASRPVLGVAAILAQDPHAAPAASAHRPAPLCHTTSSALREAFGRLYGAFAAAFREATNAAGKTTGWLGKLAFPTGSFPRPRWFLRHAGPSMVAELMRDLALERVVARPST
jgi:REP element-mobilizing transposase RayT